MEQNFLLMSVAVCPYFALSSDLGADVHDRGVVTGKFVTIIEVENGLPGVPYRDL